MNTITDTIRNEHSRVIYGRKKSMDVDKMWIIDITEHRVTEERYSRGKLLEIAVFYTDDNTYKLDYIFQP